MVAWLSVMFVIFTVTVLVKYLSEVVSAINFILNSHHGGGVVSVVVVVVVVVIV